MWYLVNSPDSSGILFCLSGNVLLMTKLLDKKDIADSGNELLKFQKLNGLFRILGGENGVSCYQNVRSGIK